MNLNSASHIEQESANSGPWVKSGLPNLTNKVLLAHGHTIPSTRVAWLCLRPSGLQNQPTKQKAL